MPQIPPVYRTPSGLSEELRRRLAAEGNCVLATVNPDGAPHLTEVLFSLDADDHVLVPTPHSTRKVANVRARPVATFFVSLRDGGWVSCTGAARVRTGEEAAAANAAIRRRLLTDSGMDTIGRLLAAHEDTTIELTPATWLSWSSAEVTAGIESLGGDVGANPPDTWFRDLADLG